MFRRTQRIFYLLVRLGPLVSFAGKNLLRMILDRFGLSTSQPGRSAARSEVHARLRIDGVTATLTTCAGQSRRLRLSVHSRCNRAIAATQHSDRPLPRPANPIHTDHAHRGLPYRRHTQFVTGLWMRMIPDRPYGGPDRPYSSGSQRIIADTLYLYDQSQPALPTRGCEQDHSNFTIRNLSTDFNPDRQTSIHRTSTSGVSGRVRP